MKKIFITILSVFALTSCVDMLNLSPIDQIASGNMWSTESLADKGVAGLYVNFYRASKDIGSIQLRYNDFSGINRQGWMGMSFECNYIGDNSSPLPPLWQQTKQANPFLIWYEWKWAYTAIHQINEALYGLSQSPLSPEKRARYESEVKFLRAWYYARLNRIYGGSAYSSELHGLTLENTPSVPLYLEMITQDECTKTQSTAKQVWDAVITDCTDCINCASFPDNTLTGNYGRPSKGAAYALRGMAYLYLENYKLAIADFEKVSECGYKFWKEGEYIDLFHHKNERNSEMIFTIQFDETPGYCDNLQLMIGGRDTWNGWSNLRPSSDFVDYFQNADGSKFEWSKVPGFEDWDELTPAQREVFFLRDGIKSGKNPVTGADWKSEQMGVFNDRIDKIGQEIFDRCYLDNGNEARIRAAYNNRDPRLKQICLTPYDPYDTFKALTDNGGKIQEGKELRWPFLMEGDDRGDYYVSGDSQSMYVFKKYSYASPDDIIDRFRCPTDWPLIRYTDVALLLAEAYVEDNQPAKAVPIINEIRSRAHMPAITATAQNDVREAVRYERRVELALECHNFFDEWRWGTYKDMKFQGNTVYGDQPYWKDWNGFANKWYYNDKMYPWPTCQQECQRNTNLVQTPGWAY